MQSNIIFQPLAECGHRGHEEVVYIHQPDVGLKAIVSIHSTVLGPSLGGCRIRAYPNESAALDDVMRLSEGMTYKNSLAGLDLGGGKACIIADPQFSTGRDDLFKRFGKFIDRLAGTYITAEDMGTTVSDMMNIRSTTKYVVGTDPNQGGGGDPSPWTARGVMLAIEAACERRYGSRSVEGKKVAVQGVGHVGGYLLEHLVKAGAKVTVSDTHEAALREASKKFGVDVVTPDGIYDVDAQIFSPCAIGQTINNDTVQRLRCEIVAGAANNQISDPQVYSLLQKREMLYCPDFAINSGGVICVGAELNPGGWKESWVKEKVDRIYSTTHRVLDEAEKRSRFPEIVAIELAKERIADAKAKSDQF